MPRKAPRPFKRSIDAPRPQRLRPPREGGLTRQAGAVLSATELVGNAIDAMSPYSADRRRMTGRWEHTSYLSDRTIAKAREDLELARLFITDAGDLAPKELVANLERAEQLLTRETKNMKEAYAQNVRVAERHARKLDEPFLPGLGAVPKGGVSILAIIIGLAGAVLLLGRKGGSGGRSTPPPLGTWADNGVGFVDFVTRFDPRGTFTDFRDSLPAHGREYALVLWSVGIKYGLSPHLLAAIMEHESNYGRALTPPGPAGTNRDGSDLGLMQINKNAHPAFVAQRSNNGTPLWQDPQFAVDYAARGAIIPYRDFFLADKQGKTLTINGRSYPDPRPLTGNTLFYATVAAYNTGPGNVLNSIARGASPDTTTAHANYSASVTGRLRTLLA